MLPINGGKISDPQVLVFLTPLGHGTARLEDHDFLARE